MDTVTSIEDIMRIKLSKDEEAELKKIVQATTSGQSVHIGMKKIKKLLSSGLVDKHPDQYNNEAGEPAVYATANGTARIQHGQAAPVEATTEEDKETGTVDNFVFASVENITLSPRARIAPRQSKYPFDKLSVGQGFFIAATEDRPKPQKMLGSVITGANKRFADKGVKFITRAGTYTDPANGATHDGVWIICTEKVDGEDGGE